MPGASRSPTVTTMSARSPGREPPPYGALALLLLIAGLLPAALATADALRGLENGLALFMLLWGAVAGATLAVLLPGPRLALPAAGLLLAATLAGRVGRLGDETLALLAQTAGALASALLPGRVPQAPWPPPAWGLLLDHLAVLSLRLRLWLAALPAGRTAYDPLAAAALWGGLTWLVAFWAAWHLLRRRSPLLAVAPAVAFFGLTLASAGRPALPLAPLLAATALLLTWSAYVPALRRWAPGGVAAGVGSGLALVTVPLVLALTGFSTLTAVLLPDLVIRYGRPADDSSAQGNPALARSLGVDALAYRITPLDPLRAPGLPNQHLIGSGPELEEQPALVVSLTSLPLEAPAPRLYWRALTYDRYTGRGWATSPTAEREYGAGEPLPADPPPGAERWRLKVRRFQGRGGLAYYPGDLAAADRPVTVTWRGGSAPDAFAATLEGDLYEVEAWVASPDPEVLRRAGQDYPEWIVERYLALPPEVPGRVLALARDLTATAATPYDRAVALETYLRAYPYTLDLPPPPEDRDVVDYFLFDLRQGYCDYYASAMVVLARAAGLPARLAVGYFTGLAQRTEGTAVYFVSEADAHAWPEIYFPGYGWVPFEPTAGRPPLPLTQTPAEDQAPAAAQPVTTAEGRARRAAAFLGGLGPWGLALAVLPLISLTGFAVFEVITLLPLSGPALAAALYRRLHRQAARLQPGLPRGATPRRAADALAAALQATPAAVRASVWGDVEQIRAYIEATLYSPRPPGRGARRQVILLWPRLVWRLRWRRLVTRLRRLGFGRWKAAGRAR